MLMTTNRWLVLRIQPSMVTWVEPTLVEPTLERWHESPQSAFAGSPERRSAKTSMLTSTGLSWRLEESNAFGRMVGMHRPEQTETVSDRLAPDGKL